MFVRRNVKLLSTVVAGFPARGMPFEAGRGGCWKGLEAAGALSVFVAPTVVVAVAAAVRVAGRSGGEDGRAGAG